MRLNSSDAEFAIDFIHDVIGARTWSKPEEIIRSVFSDQYRMTVVRSCTGAGKTKTAADIALAWLMTSPYRTVITTAPTHRQVDELLWKEIRKSIRSAESRGIKLGGNLPKRDTRYEIKDGWMMIGFSSRDEVAFQGWHSEGGTLAIIDEAVGVPVSIWEAIEGTLTGVNDRLLALANPTIPSGRFFELFKTQNKSIKKISISAFETPNVSGKEEPIKGLATPQFIEDKKISWGENSPIYRSRILGEFPDTDDFSLVPLAWVDSAIERHKSFNKDTVNPNKINSIIAGLDVARLGNDKTILSIAYYYNDGIVYIDEFHKLPKTDTMRTTKTAIDKCQIKGVDQLIVDADGIGAGVYDRAVELCDFAFEFRGGRTANNPAKFFNLRSEIIWGVRELLSGKSDLKIMLPEDDELAFQLTSIRFSELSDGRIKIETKEDWRKRTGKSSTDELDALAMSLFRATGSNSILWSKAYG